MRSIDSLERLFTPANETLTIRMGVERIAAVARTLGAPQNRFRVVHVAGTNGKGSTCAMLEPALLAAGIRTALFTSPHFDSPLERIRIDGKPIPANDFQRAFETVRGAAAALAAVGQIESELSYFETLTAMAFVCFAEASVETAVIEVGMGGLRDATNIVTPELAVITPIDFDHEAYLGKSLESIAGEKAGILKPGVPAVFARQRPEAARVLEARAVDARWTEHWPIRDLELDARGSRFRLGDLEIRCPLAGEHQVENAVTAAVALQRLGVPDRAIERGIAQAQWPGRLERVSDTPEIILDGAHNPAGARALAAYIQRFYANRRVRLIFGAMRDKAIGEISGILFPLAQQVVVTAPRQARSLAPETIRQISDHPNLTTATRIEEALELVSDATSDDVIFVTGSLFLVAEARPLLVR